MSETIDPYGLENKKRWKVIFYPTYDAPPEVYQYWNKDKRLALYQFNYFFDTRDDPDYPRMYSRIELIVEIGKISRVIDKICFEQK